MTSTTEDPAKTEATADQPRGPRILWGIRGRLLAWYVAVLAIAIGAAVLVVRQVLIVQLDQRIHEALVQESDELRRLSRGRDPITGERFGNRVRRIFEVFLQRNIPSRNETFLTFVDGEPFERSFRPPPYRLDQDPELVARWAELPEAERGRVATPAGDVEYLAVPVRDEGRTLGVFVAAVFRDAELAEIRRAVAGAGGVGLATLVIGTILAWRVTGGLLRRVRAVTDTARGISEDMTGRLEVTGHDEISHLARTFNEMLDRLEELVETQRRFVDDAGHELRTPITVIRGHLELLDDDPAERRRTLDLVTDELDRMQRIVNELLVLAKAEQPDFLDLAPVHLDRLLEEVKAKASALGPRDWQIEAAAGGIVIGDRQRLTQALMQLAQNSVQHTEEGSAIGIGSSMRNGEARLWVRDTGPGIPLEQRDRLFARFSRGAGRRRSEGAGLGLAIVRAIAEAHHGRVEVDSAPGSGATVTVVIPVDQPDERRGG